VVLIRTQQENSNNLFSDLSANISHYFLSKRRMTKTHWDGWKSLTDKFGDKSTMVGDDLVCNQC